MKSLQLSLRALRVYRICDGLSGKLIYLQVIFAPWAFGTTQPWAIWSMNIGGYSLGALLGIKLAIRALSGYQGHRWDEEETVRDELSPAAKARRFLSRCLAILTVLILLYCLISTVNARSNYHRAGANFEYFHFIPWLPHSYDQSSSRQAFYNYLALAFSFWALRDWLAGKSAAEERAERGHYEESGGRRGMLLPERLRRLLWVLAINGGLLGMEGIVQRMADTGKLLFLVQARVNRDAESQFGPYAYRSNAAQYFNLIWPACLGFWWSLQRASHRTYQRTKALRPKAHDCVLISVIIMAACPIISTTRAGALVTVVGLFAAAAILWTAQRKGDFMAKAGILIFLVVTLGFGALLGWKRMAPRIETEVFDKGLAKRNSLYEIARKIAEDYPMFGTGPGTFESVFQIYRINPEAYWPAQLHNDWLETRITFGWLGSILIYLALIVVLARWFVPGGIPGGVRLAMLIWLGMAGCLVHARYDFPFQIYSIVFVFLVLCAILFSITCKGRKS